nr:hypothetical protein B0A51_12710 [Rachicladosporium sp. CCFEE 5018]
MHLVFYGWNYSTLYYDQLVGLMKHYGGHLQPHASEESSWVILGEYPAPPKYLKKVKELGLPTTNEAGFFELIRRLPGTGPSTFTPEVAKKMGASAARKAAKSRQAALLAQANGSNSVAIATPRNIPSAPSLQVLANTSSAGPTISSVETSVVSSTTGGAAPTVLTESRNGANRSMPVADACVKSEPRASPGFAGLQLQSNVVQSPTLPNTADPEPTAHSRIRKALRTNTKTSKRPTGSGLTWLAPLTTTTGVLKRTYADREVDE